MPNDQAPHIASDAPETIVRHRVRVTGLVLSFAMNVALAIISFFILGHAAGWMAPERLNLPGVLGYGLPFLQFLAFGFLIDRGFLLFVGRMAETDALGRAPPRLGVQLGRLLIYFCILSATISSVFNRSITGILAASGVVGLVLGFALRGLVSDLFFGIALHLDQNISTGDWIDFSYRGKEFTGRLRDIHWRSVICEDIHSNLMLIPNSEFATTVVINRSKLGNATEYTAFIGLGNEYECGRVLTVLEMVLQQLIVDRVILDKPPPTARIAQIEGGVIKYRLAYHVYPDRMSAVDSQSAVLRSALQFLRSAGFYLYPLFPNYTNPAHLPPDRPQSHEVRLRILASVPLLRVLSPQALESVAEGAEGHILSAGSVLINAGESGNTMWVISEGSFDVIVEKNGVPTIVSTLWPGDWVGEMSLLTGEPRTATVQSRTAGYVYAINKPTMEKLFEADPGLIKTLAQIAGRRRKARERPFPLMSSNQDLAKTKSTIARIREFFGLPPAT